MPKFNLFILVLILLSCTSKRLTNKTELKRDEKNLWLLVKKEQEQLNSSQLIYDEIELTKYVNKVLKSMLDSTHNLLDVDVKIIKSPYFNAFAYPNGSVYIHTGLLTSINNEHQLATILGHEINHAIYRHTIRQMDNASTTSSFFSILTAGTLNISPGANLLGTVFGGIATQASISGYSKSMEYEADEYGLNLMKKAKYDYNEAPKVFQILKNDLERSEIEEPFFFGSHPKLNTRIKNLNKMISKFKTHDQFKPIDSLDYKLKIGKTYLINAQLNLASNRSIPAILNIQKYHSIISPSANSNYLLGESYRLLADKRKKEENISLAKDHYIKSLKINPNHEQSLLRMGKLFYKEGQLETAKNYFTKYVKLCNSCTEKSFANYYLNKIEKEL